MDSNFEEQGVARARSTARCTAASRAAERGAARHVVSRAVRTVVAVLACAGGLAPSAAAQIQTQIVVDQTLLVQLGSQSQSLPVGTDLTNGGGIALGSGCSAPGDTSVSAVVQLSGAEILFQPGVFTPAWCSGQGSAAGAVRIRYTSATPVLATIVGSVRAGGSTTSGSVEVLGGARIDASFPIVRSELEQAVLVDSAGVDVVVAGSASFPFSGGSASGGGRVQLVSAGARLSAAGSACGPSLRAWYLGESRLLSGEVRTLGLDVTNSIVTPYAFVVFGITAIDQPIPPTNCSLRTDILVPLPVQVGAGGSLSLVVPIPGSLTRTDLRMQYVVATQAQHWMTSEVVRLRLP